jgi:predicted DNA-binding transcriptional regulator AlpA
VTEDRDSNAKAPRTRGRPVPDRITRDGRTLITRAEVARLTGLSESAVAGLYSRRAASGHPNAVHRDGRWLYFDEHDILDWHHRRQTAKKATLTHVDRTGDPDELLDRHAAARLLGYTAANVIDSYRARNTGYFPDPDAGRPLRWRRATLWAFADRRSRPGRAGHRAPAESEHP